MFFHREDFLCLARYCFVTVNPLLQRNRAWISVTELFPETEGRIQVGNCLLHYNFIHTLFLVCFVKYKYFIDKVLPRFQKEISLSPCFTQIVLIYVLSLALQKKSLSYITNCIACCSALKILTICRNALHTVPQQCQSQLRNKDWVNICHPFLQSCFSV